MKRSMEWAALAAAALLAGLAWAVDPASAVSGEAALDTRTLCAAVLADDTELDSRSFTVDLSDGIGLNTKRIVGTAILVR
jgi:hypothetical protein